MITRREKAKAAKKLKKEGKRPLEVEQPSSSGESSKKKVSKGMLIQLFY